VFNVFFTGLGNCLESDSILHMVPISGRKVLDDRCSFAVVGTFYFAQNLGDLRMDWGCETMRTDMNHLAYDKESGCINMSDKSAKSLDSVFDLYRMMACRHVDVGNTCSDVVFPLEIDDSDPEIVHGVVAEDEIRMIDLGFFTT